METIANIGDLKCNSEQNIFEFQECDTLADHDNVRRVTNRILGMKRACFTRKCHV